MVNIMIKIDWIYLQITVSQYTTEEIIKNVSNKKLHNVRIYVHWALLNFYWSYAIKGIDTLQ